MVNPSEEKYFSASKVGDLIFKNLFILNIYNSGEKGK